jgi:hypothetical protein
MTFLSKLEVVNSMLALLGETPLNAIDEDHDLTASALNILKVANYREQAKAWWFNKEVVTLSPDSSTGHIFIPADTIKIDPTRTTLDYVARGRRLYRPYATASEDKWVFTSNVECELVRLLDFEDLPVTAQLFVQASARLEFQNTQDGDPNRTAGLNKEYTGAFITLNAEHIRNRDANVLRRPSIQRALNNIGYQASPAGLPIA